MITKMSCLQSLWTGVNPVWAGKSSRLQMSLWTEVSPVCAAKLSSLQMSLWTEVTPAWTGNSRSVEMPALVDRSWPCVGWEVQEPPDVLIDRSDP